MTRRRYAMVRRTVVGADSPSDAVLRRLRLGRPDCSRHRRIRPRSGRLRRRCDRGRTPTRLSHAGREMTLPGATGLLRHHATCTRVTTGRCAQRRSLVPWVVAGRSRRRWRGRRNCSRRRAGTGREVLGNRSDRRGRDGRECIARRWLRCCSDGSAHVAPVRATEFDRRGHRTANRDGSGSAVTRGRYVHPVATRVGRCRLASRGRVRPFDRRLCAWPALPGRASRVSGVVTADGHAGSGCGNRVHSCRRIGRGGCHAVTSRCAGAGSGPSSAVPFPLRIAASDVASNAAAARRSSGSSTPISKG